MKNTLLVPGSLGRANYVLSETTHTNTLYTINIAEKSKHPLDVFTIKSR